MFPVYSGNKNERHSYYVWKFNERIFNNLKVFKHFPRLIRPLSVIFWQLKIKWKRIYHFYPEIFIEISCKFFKTFSVWLKFIISLSVTKSQLWIKTWNSTFNKFTSPNLYEFFVLSIWTSCFEINVSLNCSQN